MSVCSEMEKNSTEDDGVDSGAETGGSDYSPMSSASSEPLRGDLHDPYLVSVHIITDSGTGKPLQRAADTALAWIHPDLQLFRVSERAPGQRRSKRVSPSGSVPGLAVFLFLREGPAGCLLRTLQRPPWRCYPSERAPRAGLDLFSLGAGTPPWAVRQVHCGREVIRLALNCRHEAFADTVRLYCLLVRRRLTQSTDNFCFFVVYASTDVEIHLSLKRLPRGQSPAPTESAILEFRVQDVGALVPLLPQPCMPISETRWQTEDYDGNKILLQVRGSARNRRRHTIAQFADLPVHSSVAQSHRPSERELPPAAAPPCARGPASYRNRRFHRTSSRLRHQNSQDQKQNHSSLQDLPGVCKEDETVLRRDPAASRAWWAGHRSRSLFCLPTADASCPTPSTTLSTSHSQSSLVAPPFRLNVDALVGAVETDVDTGRKLAGGGIVDLSVVSGYSCRPTRSISATPVDLVPSFSGRSCSFRASSSRPPPARVSISASATPIATPTALRRPRPRSTCSLNNTWQRGGAEVENGLSEEEQEFYI
ncbi:protein FAM124A isoform X1 [Scleropages formosus]|uniref:Family with sequence similarity 124 member A n=1 Tax=Scleropages formosus TaxID=113540 RepID=A0A8C9QXV1_SCLFO|nr:protein FAM124A isoform X1 [Scleropages formosus]